MVIGRIALAPPERRELERRARSRTLEAEDCKRAKLILLVAKGDSFAQICRRLDRTDRYISVWKRRCQEGRLSGLDSRYRGSQRRVRTAETEAKILEATRKGPTDGTTHLAKGNDEIFILADCAASGISRQAAAAILNMIFILLFTFCLSPERDLQPSYT
jgi:hypothetical protein